VPRPGPHRSEPTDVGPTGAAPVAIAPRRRVALPVASAPPASTAAPVAATVASPAADVELDADEFSAAITAVTSAFGDPTRREIYLSLRRSGVGATAADIAERFALHANVARHHLEKLAAGGYVDVELVRGEAAGRPSKRYRAARHDTTLTFPPRRDALLGMLLARALERLDPAEATVIAEEVGHEYGVSLAARMSPSDGHRSLKAAMAAVADALTAHGFAARTEGDDGDLSLVAEHCPFGDAAEQYPHVMCAIDRGMVRGMLASLFGAADPHMSESRPEGDEHCVTRV
jgi:predicted ArsR family transcriptional regulator